MASPVEGEAATPVWHHRVESVLRVADLHRTGVELDTLVESLTLDAPTSRHEMGRWLKAHRSSGAVVDGRAYHSIPVGAEYTPIRQERARRYVAAASALFARELGFPLRWIRCAAVTGSTAYGEAEEGDDCDLLVVTDRGALWLVLGLAFLRLRFRGARRPPDDPPVWCLNYVVDDSTLLRDYAAPQGFLFAREALMPKVVLGDAFYRGVLGSSPWLEAEAPRLFARWRAGGLPSTPVPRKAPFVTRLLNAGAFLAIAPYLQLVGLVRNHRYRRASRLDRLFQTVTRPNRLEIASAKFDALNLAYARATAVPGSIA